MNMTVTTIKRCHSQLFFFLFKPSFVFYGCFSAFFLEGPGSSQSRSLRFFIVVFIVCVINGVPEEFFIS